MIFLCFSFQKQTLFITTSAWQLVLWMKSDPPNKKVTLQTFFVENTPPKKTKHPPCKYIYIYICDFFSQKCFGKIDLCVFLLFQKNVSFFCHEVFVFLGFYVLFVFLQKILLVLMSIFQKTIVDHVTTVMNIFITTIIITIVTIIGGLGVMCGVRVWCVLCLVVWCVCLVVWCAVFGWCVWSLCFFFFGDLFFGDSSSEFLIKKVFKVLHLWNIFWNFPPMWL